MKSPRPIPTPLAMHWREFRVRFLPVLFFLAAVCVAAYLWKDSIASPALVGAVEVRSAQVNAPYAGKIARFDVTPFQNVSKGAPVAVLVPNDPRSALAVIQSELDILQARLEPDLTQQRNETDYEQMRMDWLAQRVLLATARVNYALAHSELVRTQELHELKLVSDDLYDIAIKTEEALSVEVFERSNLVIDAAQEVKHLETLGTPSTNGPIQSLMAALQTEEQKVILAAAGTQPVVLTAPMDGEVSAIVRQAGENLVAGDPILTITATEPEHIISYLRQPIPFEPTVGMSVEVRTRTFQIQSGHAHVENVGVQFEGITNALALLRPGVPVDLGLPIQISLPPELKLRPGELVDLSLQVKD